METATIPIDDNNISPPPINNMINDHDTESMNNDSTPINTLDYQQPIYMPVVGNQSKDIFSELSKTTIVVAFVIFILGLFIGKTMHPVIIKAT